MTLRKLISLLSVAFMAAFLGLAVQADEKDKDKGKEQTITGEGQCAKCSLKETDKCQTAIVVEKDSKKTTYYLVANDVAKKFHSNICQETKKVKAVGTVEEKDGKMELTASKIEVVKED